jgi:hypothetical protein
VAAGANVLKLPPSLYEEGREYIEGSGWLGGPNERRDTEKPMGEDGLVARRHRIRGLR